MPSARRSTGGVRSAAPASCWGSCPVGSTRSPKTCARAVSPSRCRDSAQRAEAQLSVEQAGQPLDGLGVVAHEVLHDLFGGGDPVDQADALADPVADQL